MTTTQTFKLEDEPLAIDFDFIYDEQRQDRKLTGAAARLSPVPSAAHAKPGPIFASTVPADQPSHQATPAAPGPAPTAPPAAAPEPSPTPVDAPSVAGAPAPAAAPAAAPPAAPAEASPAPPAAENSTSAPAATSTAPDAVPASQPATQGAAPATMGSSTGSSTTSEAPKTPAAQAPASETEAATPRADTAISINLSGPTELRFERDGRVIQGFCELKHLRSAASGGVWLNLQHGSTDQKSLADMAHYEGIGVSFSWYLQPQ